MKLSIFTPTNNPSKISLPYRSILKQKELNPKLNIEWVIIPNNNVDIPTEIVKQEWTRIYRCPSSMKNVGALKKFACEMATGDVFIELDHDDELLPGSLEEYQSLLEGKENAFLYSDKIVTRHDNKPHFYGKGYGWEHYNWNGHLVNKSFLPCARSLSEIYYAPDHIRAWTRKSYELAGKHDDKLFVGDDHELIIRTYLAGSEFIFLDKPTYNYYVHGQNTWLQNNNAVQVQQRANRDKYLRKLVAEWCKRKNYKSIVYPSKEFFEAEPNSLGCVYSNDTISSVPAGKPVVEFMNSVYEKLVPGGWFLIDTASTDGRGAWCDPTHVSFWNELSFRYFTNKDFSKFVPGVTCKFQQVVLNTHFPSKWYEDNKLPFVRSDMCALKGQRAPGWQYI